MHSTAQLRNIPGSNLLSPSYLIVLLIGCLLLLSGCSDINKSGVARKAASGPTINGQLRQQGQMKMLTFRKWIALMQQYKGDVDQYRQEYSNDQQALIFAKTELAYRTALQGLNKHVNSIRIQTLKTQANTFEHQLSQEVSAWSKQHTHYNAYNGVRYHLGYEYGVDGVGGVLHDSIAEAKTLADYQNIIEDAQAFLASFQAYQRNSLDKTPWNKTHATDLQLMQHYDFTQQKVVVVSLSEQAMRIYNKGKLVKAFQVTTGRPDKPSLPGKWEVESKQSPTIFKSSEPRGSVYWYPDTPINYAMLYHSGGYFIHDSWWRSDYGPDTQFPHADSSGDSFSFNGSHGCINLATPNAAWLYNYVTVATHVLVY